MPGTRTAPALTAAAQFKRLSISYIDESGDVRTESIDMPVAATAAQAEAYVDALQAVSNASIYKVELTDMFFSVPDSSNALEEAKDSVFDNLVFLAKSNTNLSKRLFIPAPSGDVFLQNTDQFDGNNTDLAACLAAFLVLLGAGWDLASGRYTERREINSAQRF